MDITNSNKAKGKAKVRFVDTANKQQDSRVTHKKPNAKPQPTQRQIAVKTSLYKKKDWDDKVFAIMEEHLFEGCIEAQNFRRIIVRYLEPKHYEAVMQERAANRICAYAICANPLMEIKGTYRISSTQKKVFDISPMKNFCSKECMAASNFLAEQIPLDPAYLRPSSNLSDHELDETNTIELIDAAGLVAIRNKSFTTTSYNESAQSVYIKSLLAQTPKPPPLPKSVATNTIFNPDALVIKESSNASPEDSTKMESMLQSLSLSGAETAEMLEGFRVFPATSRKKKNVVATTDILFEYTERRNNAKSKKYIPKPSITHEFAGPKITNSDLTSIDIDIPVTLEIPSAEIFAAAAREAAEINPRVSLNTELNVARKAVTSPEVPTTRIKTPKPTNFEESDLEDSPSWPLPSTKSIAKAAAAVSTLSLFGRIWNSLMTIVTSETVKYVKHGPETIDMDTFMNQLLEGGIADLDALLTRGRIFSEKIIKCATGLCRRHSIKTPLQKDLVEFLGTLYIRESGVMLHPLEEKILSIVFIKVVADAMVLSSRMESPGFLRDEVCSKLVVEQVVMLETGGAMSAAEIGALARGVFV
ncbi:hypothetical protein HK100_001075 [Physocladia obscura]|uniref:RNA polymerase II subunit B1 CTD phosphatase RPAP2 homolog n=1 Tax=Physocladia obscura TaxID=109957 RepID=A0AAD5T9D0_9FUNG|nr:hypothetical protein HK100_001075 [Physocladia obscura]